MAVELRPPPAPTNRPPRRPGLGETLRQAWREYRSMRTALVLLVVLAAASILGSLFPQEGLSPQRVDQYFLDHPALAPVLERLGLFDVFGSAWYMAIYLALLGALVMQSLQSGMTLLNFESAYKDMVVGTVLVTAVFVDQIYRRRVK